MLLSIMQNVLTLPYFKIFRKDFLWDRVKAQGAVIVLACRYRRLFSLLDRRLGRPLWRERGETAEFDGYHRFIYDLITILVSVLSRPNPLAHFAHSSNLTFSPRKKALPSSLFLRRASNFSSRAGSVVP